MSESKLHTMAPAAAVDAIAGGALTARTLAEAQLTRVAATDTAIETWAHLDPDHVRAVRSPLNGLA